MTGEASIEQRRRRGGIRSAVVTNAGANVAKDVSRTPLVRKLGIKPGARVALLGAPDGL